MTDLTRTHLSFTVDDRTNIQRIRNAYPRLSKIGAVRHALEVAALVATGDARLVDKQGKPIRIVATG